MATYHSYNELVGNHLGEADLIIFNLMDQIVTVEWRENERGYYISPDLSVIFNALNHKDERVYWINILDYKGFNRPDFYKKVFLHLYNELEEIQRLKETSETLFID